jgi:hypothetical protein
MFLDQTPSGQADSGVFQGIPHYEAQVGFAVGVGRKGPPPVHSALRHVAWDAGHDTAVTPGHLPDRANARPVFSGESRSSG